MYSTVQLTQHVTYVPLNCTAGLSVLKPEPFMLVILPINLTRISHVFTNYSLFIPILYYFSNLIVSLIKLHMAADKCVHFSVIKINNIDIINSS